MLELTNEAGVDEAGLGCLWGIVVAGAVLLPEKCLSDKQASQIKDSKKLSAKKREELAKYIKENALAWGIGTANVEEIDKFNISEARILAMHRAIQQAQTMKSFEKLAIDGTIFHHDTLEFRCIIKGDDKFLNIAAASILAKTYRDNWVIDILKEHPDWQDKYGFETNKGYGTKKHLDGLKKHGIVEYHRRSYSPVALASESVSSPESVS